jgi:uncharacterized protein with HEPN domain
MRLRVIKCLSDILYAIQLIEQFIAEFDNSEVYQNNPTAQNAVERQLITIGEAIVRIKRMDTSIEISGAAEIIGMRNFLVHNYDSIAPFRVWETIIKDLPTLKAEVQTLLNQ